MPNIDTALLLDILLGLVILLFVPFGIRRGVAKEAMVSAGLLLGAILAGRFNETWGAELAARLSLDAGAARFVVATSFLLGGAFLLGYGGGAALGPMRPGMFSRLAGGVLAAFNGGLLLSYLLRWIDEFLAGGATLDEGILGEALLRRSDSLLLGAAGVVLLMTVVGWVVNAVRSRRQPREFESQSLAGIPARQRPLRVAAAADEGKREPGGNPTVRSGRFGSGVDSTAPLLPEATPVAHGFKQGDGSAMLATNGYAATQFENGGAGSGYESQTRPDDTVWAAWAADPASPSARTRGEPAGQWPVASSPGITDDQRCAVCLARIGARDVFCPECGATL